MPTVVGTAIPKETVDQTDAIMAKPPVRRAKRSSAQMAVAKVQSLVECAMLDTGTEERREGSCGAFKDKDCSSPAPNSKRRKTKTKKKKSKSKKDPNAPKKPKNAYMVISFLSNAHSTFFRSQFVFIKSFSQTRTELL